MGVKLSPSAYRIEKRRKALAQGLRCANCGRPMLDLEWHHRMARGMGGGWREDSEENGPLICRRCHSSEPYSVSKFTGEPRKNSKRTLTKQQA